LSTDWAWPWILAFLISPALAGAAGPTAAPAPADEASPKESFKKGVVLFQQKQFDEAVKALLDVPELGGYLSTYKHWFLGQAYLELGKYKQAEPEFSKIMQSQVSSELTNQARFLLGDVALRQKNYVEGIARLTPLERKWRRSHRYPELLYKLLSAEMRLGRHLHACRRARTLYADYPTHGLVGHWTADLASVTIEGKALGCAPTRDDFADRVRNMQLSGDTDKAKQEIQARLAKSKEKAQDEMLLASLLVMDGDTDEALKRLIHYYPQMKKDIPFLLLLARAAARSGEYVTAVGAYEQAYNLSPGSKQGREALYQAAHLSYQFQDYDGAVRKFTRFIQSNPRSGLAKEAQWHMAWLQYLRGDFKGALARLASVAKTVRRGNESLQDRLRYWAAMAHLRLGDLESAREALQNLVARNPYSYYGLAAQARLDQVIANLAKNKNRLPARVENVISVETKVASAEISEENESEETLSEGEDEVNVVSEGPEPEEGLQPSSFRDPAMRARIEVAQKLIQLGLPELAKWELWEVEKRTRNKSYLTMLIATYESIGFYNRAASIAELNFAKEREVQGIEIGEGLWMSMFPQAYKNNVAENAKRFGVPSEWVWAIMRAESVYKPDVISPVGARGLMQLMPFTARNLMRLLGENDKSEIPDLFTPQVNIQLGAQYLGRLQQKFKGQLPLVAAAYNAGPHRVEGWLVNFGHLEMDEFVEHIPFLETRNYVKKVVRNHTLYRRLYAKDLKSVESLSKTLGVPIPSRASTRESWEAL